ncbi:MAG TPA: DUF11 domain-containing protein [Acidimicrobiia bacterium]|nr:DUF11 domain-containing protein [Acidimicrobiia bacterium]
MLTSRFKKRTTLGVGLLAVLLTGVPHAVAEARFRLPYGDGTTVGPAAPVGPPRQAHGYTPPMPGSSRFGGRFGPTLGPPSGRPSADLQLSMTSAPNPATQGGQFDYTLSVTNAGPAPTTDVTVMDQLPSGVRLVQTAASQGVCSLAQQYVRCALGTLDGGRNATVTITVTAVRAGTIYNTASVMGREYDPYEGNNTATATTNVQSGGTWAADLGVANSVDRDTADAGENLTYTISVTNAGPAVAVGTHVADQLPEGAEFVSATPSQGSCSSSNSDVVCELGDMASAGTATVTVVVRVLRPGTAVNVAYVTSQMLDENGGNNQAQATTEVGGGGETPGVGPIRPGPVGPGRPGPAGPVGPAGPPRPV